MGDIIKKLSSSTANQITAGEVVRRPSSVVKELMENAIDAKSTMIIVKVIDGGKELIQVIDDGVGMSSNDAFAAFERHATSKITETKDIYNLSTFGFRGEALPSIASVSEIELKTCRDEDEIGCRVVITGGELQKHVKELTAKGTHISVKKLFYNVPQRWKFLNKKPTEMRHIIAEFKKIALCNPHIQLFLYDGEKCLYNLPIGTLRQRVTNINNNISKDVKGGMRNVDNLLMEICNETPLVTIKGYIGTPKTCTKESEQFMFVNGRYFRTSYFNKAITRAFENIFTNPNVIPRYFLYFTISPSEIDVNADPQKVDVRFENESQIWHILLTAVKGVLGKNGIVPSIDFDVASELVISDGDSFREMGIEEVTVEEFNPFTENFSFTKAISTCGNGDDDMPYRNAFHLTSDSNSAFVSESGKPLLNETFTASSSFNESKFSLSNDVSQYDSIFENEDEVSKSNIFGQETVNDNVKGFENSNDDFLTSSAFSSSFTVDSSMYNDDIHQKDAFENENTIKSYDLTKLGRCSLFADKYIIAPIGDKLLFITMITALRRVSYDKHVKMMSTDHKGSVHKLIFPITIPLSVTHRAIIDQCKPDLESIGFEIKDGDIDVAIEITGIPNGYDKYNIYEVFEDILESVSGDDIDGYNQEKKERLTHRLSSVEATKRSKSLNSEEYELIVRELFECENHNTSPSGKLIFAELDKINIEKLLK